MYNFTKQIEIIDSFDTLNKLKLIKQFNITPDTDVCIEVELEITFFLLGKDLPATFYEEAEYAEVDIETPRVKKIILSYEIAQVVIDDLSLTDKANILDAIQKDIDWEELEADCWSQAEREDKYNNDNYNYD